MRKQSDWGRSCARSTDMTAREAKSARTAEARLPTNDGSYTSFWWLIDIPKCD